MKVIEKFKGVIEDVLVPEVYDKYGFLDEDMIDMTKIVVKTEKGLIEVYAKRDNRIKDYYYQKEVVVEKYMCDGTYEDYLSVLNSYIKNNGSSLTEKEKQLVYDKFKFSEEEYQTKQQSLPLYGIEGLDIA